jgi:hypothetical protein
MIVAHTISDAPSRPLLAPLVQEATGLLATPRPLRYKLVYDDDGKVIGRIVAPRNDDVFGTGRGAVFLTRD